VQRVVDELDVFAEVEKFARLVRLLERPVVVVRIEMQASATTLVSLRAGVSNLSSSPIWLISLKTRLLPSRWCGSTAP